MRHKLGALAMAAAALFVLAAGSCQGHRGYRAERFAVDMAVHPDGSATITETVTFAFRSGPFTYAFRDIPTRYTDEIGQFTVSEDGRAYSQGPGPGQYEVEGSAGGQRVTWRFHPTENRSRTFVLTYRVEGLVRQEGSYDALRWAAVPAERSYAIGRAEVVVRLPVQAGPPAEVRVLEGEAQPGVLGQQVSFQATSLEREQPLVIGIWFPHGQLEGVPPAWQEQQMAQASLAPAWFALAGLLLALALAGSLWAWQRYGRERVSVAHGPIQAPPSDLLPGLVGALIRNGATVADALATLFDLGRRGVLAVEQTRPPRRRRQAGCALRVLALPPDLHPVEVQILRIAAAKTATGKAQLCPDYGTMQGLVADGKAIALVDLAASLQANERAIESALNTELRALGLFDQRRDHIRRCFLVGGLAVMLLALLSIALARVWWVSFGPWPLLVFAALAASGLILVMVGMAASRRSAAGERSAHQWKAFRRHLRRIARGRGGADPATPFASYLPYAVAFGLHSRWTRQMAAAQVPAPAWFRALDPGTEKSAGAASLVAVMAAISASTSGGNSSGSAGGAAGGGASGAG